MSPQDKPKYPQLDQVTSYGGDGEITDIDKLSERIKSRLGKYQKVADDTFTRAKKNRKYATNSFDKEDTKALVIGEDGIFVPKIRENLEQQVPLVTEQSPDTDCKIKPRQGSGSKKKMSEVKILLDSFFKEFWEVKNYMQKRMEQGVRNYQCQGFMAYKILFDPTQREYKIYVVPAGRLIFPEDSDPDDLPWIIEKVSDTFGNIVKKHFTDTNGVVDEKRKEEFKNLIKVSGGITDDTKVDHIEYWEPSIVAWKFEDMILGAEKNPNFDFDKDAVNHFKNPEIPYIIENAYSFGDKVADDVTSIEATKSLADSLNKRKRQIDLNADDANGQIVFNGDFVGDDQVKKYKRNRQNAITAKSKNAQNPVNLDNVVAFPTGRGMGAEVVNDMDHTELHIDNEWGTHDVSRGESDTTTTATGDTIRAGGDKTKNGTLTRMIERTAQKIDNYLLQLVYIFGDEDYELFNIDAEIELQPSINKNILKEYRVLVNVKNGSTLPKNPAAEGAQAVALAEAGKESTIDLYRDLGMDDPEGRAKRAWMEANGFGQQLYQLDGNTDMFSVDAMRVIMQIQAGEIDGSDPANVYHGTDLAMYKSYVKTMTDYLAGKEIDSDLIPFEELTPDKQEQIQVHTQQCLVEFQLMQQQQMVEAKKQQQIEQSLSLTNQVPDEELNPKQSQSPQQSGNGLGAGMSQLSPQSEPTQTPQSQLSANVSLQ